MRLSTFSVALTGLAWLSLAGCGRPSGSSVTRLIDRFQQGAVKKSPAKRNLPKPSGLWSFGEPAAGAAGEKAMLGWNAGNGVSGLTLRDGRLKGHTTSNFPIIYVERTGKLETPDLLNSIEVRLKVSKGTNLMVTTQGQAELNFKDILERAKELKQPWPFTSAIVPGEDLQTIVLSNASTTRLANVRKLLIRPTDEEGADFEIES